METSEKTSKNSIAIKYGLISGLVGIILFVIQDFAGIAGNQEYSWVSMLLSIAVYTLIIIYAQKEFINSGDGFMSYGQGLGLGTLVALYSSIISSIFTFFYISFINTSYLDLIKEQQMIAFEKQGLSDAQIEQAMKMAEMFTSPIAIFIFGLFGGVFFGFIVSLVVTAFTKKAQPEFD